MLLVDQAAWFCLLQTLQISGCFGTQRLGSIRKEFDELRESLVAKISYLTFVCHLCNLFG
jgi:hypothetical protein